MMDVAVLWKRLERLTPTREELEQERRRTQERDERLRRAEEKLASIRDFASTLAETSPQKRTP